MGLTLEQLAERAKLTPNYLGTIEAGQRDPSLSTVMAIAHGLRLPVGELIGTRENLSPAALEGARLLDASPLDVQDAVLRLLRSVGRRRR